MLPISAGLLGLRIGHCFFRASYRATRISQRLQARSASETGRSTTRGTTVVRQGVGEADMARRAHGCEGVLDLRQARFCVGPMSLDALLKCYRRISS